MNLAKGTENQVSPLTSRIMEMEMLQLDPTANMGQIGSSVLRAIQNNSDPLMDLFVRESIQNSLDAGDKEITTPYVNVEFLIQEFKASELNASLNDISDQLNKRFTNECYKFIAVKDTNTTGLTGPLKRSEVRDNIYGNLQKLVYHVGKPQENLGAGGSWGYGKTLYYRISKIGLVVYYSRIKKENGEFEARLCAVICENEKSRDAILPPCDNNNNKSGIAWWGEVDNDNNTYPITDEARISEFLKIFDIKPYTQNEVGTIVIIPYINEQALKREKTIEPNLGFDEDDFLNADKLSLEEELRLAIQRWYSPRLCNPQYQIHHKKNGKKVKYLRAYINGEEITLESMHPTFRCIQDLYNGAILCIDKESNTNDKISTEIIRYNQQEVGVLSYTIIKKEDLMLKSKSPYSLFNIETDNKQGNIPIVCMTRLPGMIVQYNPSTWSNLPLTQNDDYIFAMFVLNSGQTLCLKGGLQTDLEEYIRQSENADHLGWQDHVIKDNPLVKDNPRRINCIGKITALCCNILNEKFSIKEKNEGANSLSGLSTLLGKILSIRPNKKGTSGGHSHTKDTPKEDNGIKYTIGDDISYSETCISFNVRAMSKKEISKTTLLLGTMVDSSFINCDNWEQETGLVSPFSIKNYVINNYQNVNESFEISLQKTTKHGETYGIRFSSRDKQKHIFLADITITISLKRKDLLPNIKF
ncbi:MAG: hypothetical protein IKO82_04230 [Prevotella sp.]|nr:hypothetical protein [Prevotella sp.]